MSFRIGSVGPRGLAVLGVTAIAGVVLANHGWSAYHGTTPPGSPGPLLSSEPYAQYAFQVWPGTPSAAANAALTGLSVTVRSQAGGLSVTAGVNGQPAGAPHLYRSGARVYVVEASMGDDSGASDYNLGDDGLVVTDAEGRIVQ